MRLFRNFFSAGIAVLALPTDLILRSPITPSSTLTLTQPLNATSSPRNGWRPICFDSTAHLTAVNRFSCAPLLAWVASRPDAAVPTRWAPNPVQPEWTLQSCRVGIVSGNWESIFSLTDVVAQVLRILIVCQPPPQWGSGGSAPLGETEGLTYAAFHVQVTGVEPTGGQA